ncbi:MAG: 3-keto-disaccharide hydrolase [Chitinophagaceae bacterium]
MKKLLLGSIILLFFAACSTVKKANKNNGWIDLFDGKSLDGWKASENPATFSVENGMIVVHGPRAHLFYEGPLMNHNFKDFELKVKVMTMAGSNSGIFIHTQYQENGWPSKGYEVQVNNSHTDWRRTGSLYGVDDVKEVYVKDNEWYTEDITVKGKNIIIKINDKTVVNYTEPDNVEQLPDRAQKHLSSGTFALQGHDPASKVFFKEVKVRVL